MVVATTLLCFFVARQGGSCSVVVPKLLELKLSSSSRTSEKVKCGYTFFVDRVNKSNFGRPIDNLKTDITDTGCSNFDSSFDSISDNIIRNSCRDKLRDNYRQYKTLSFGKTFRGIRRNRFYNRKARDFDVKSTSHPSASTGSSPGQCQIGSTLREFEANKLFIDSYVRKWCVPPANHITVRDSVNVLAKSIFPRVLSRSVSTDVKENELTHLSKDGKANMVDVGSKEITSRIAIASCNVILGPNVFTAITDSELKKGNALDVARIAGIMAAKQTSSLIPLCHNIPITKVSVDFHMDAARSLIKIAATVSTVGKTGVEMEALTAVSVSALTVYDMCKALSHDVVITDVKLERKTGGKSGDYVRLNK